MRVLARTLTTAIVGSARALSRARPTASLSNAPTVTLNDGTSHPQIGFGTYKVGFIPASAGRRRRRRGERRGSGDGDGHRRRRAGCRV